MTVNMHRRGSGGIKFSHAAKDAPIAWALLIDGSHSKPHVLKIYVHLKGRKKWTLFETKQAWHVGARYDYARLLYPDITVMEVDE